MAAALVSHFQKTLGAFARPLRRFVEEVATCPPEPRRRRRGRNGNPEREVGVGGPSMHVDREVDGGLHLGGRILTNLGAQG